MIKEKAHYFLPFKIRTLQDQRFLMAWVLVSFTLSVLLTLYFAGRKITSYVSPRLPFNFIASLNPQPENYIPEPAKIPPWDPSNFGTDKLTFVLLGYDEVDRYAHRSDTLMIGGVDFYARKVKMLSLPRDTLVHIPRHGFQKVNAAYALGGEDLVRKTIENFAGVQIDYVIAVNYQGFIDIVDNLGGVDITVERAMHYDDRRGFTHIHIEPGEHHFNGAEALNYVRFRHDARGDLGRIERQQKFLAALFDQAIKPSNWPNLLNAAQSFLDNIEISVNQDSPRHPPEIGLNQIISAMGFLSQVGRENIEFHQIPTVDIRYHGLACLRPIYSETRELMETVFMDDEPISWDVADGEIMDFPADSVGESVSVDEEIIPAQENEGGLH